MYMHTDVYAHVVADVLFSLHLEGFEIRDDEAPAVFDCVLLVNRHIPVLMSS